MHAVCFDRAHLSRCRGKRLLFSFAPSRAANARCVPVLEWNLWHPDVSCLYSRAAVCIVVKFVYNYSVEGWRGHVGRCDRASDWRPRWRRFDSRHACRCAESLGKFFSHTQSHPSKAKAAWKVKKTKNWPTSVRGLAASAEGWGIVSSAPLDQPLVVLWNGVNRPYVSLSVRNSRMEALSIFQ